ncbi:hypothetical protein C7B61_00715 [filamentous cyanobacterium CCP1]|nr:hypothetical protein C7B76_19865 [filamentous cyanobacterium CCP2]PSB68464.1 hypothetical protein C7B61_00715 [filamentous cyanobacterium CCP1]
MVDIDVNHWRNLQSLLLESAKGKRRIILIHENSEILKLVHSGREAINRTVARVENPHEVAQKLYQNNQDKADFVVVFERNAVDRYTAQFQDTWKAEEDLDEFVHRQYALMDEFPDGIVTYPRPARETLGLQWRVGATYDEIKAAVNHYVEPDSTVVFGIFEGETLWATLVLHFDADRRVNVITTVDPSELRMNQGREMIAKEVVEWVNRKYPACSIGLFTDLDSARNFISSQDKGATIRELVEQGKLIADPFPGSLTKSFATV